MQVQTSLLACWGATKDSNNWDVDMRWRRRGEEEGAKGRVAGRVGRVKGGRESKHVEVGMDNTDGEKWLEVRGRCSRGGAGGRGRGNGGGGNRGRHGVLVGCLWGVLGLEYESRIKRR